MGKTDAGIAGSGATTNEAEVKVRARGCAAELLSRYVRKVDGKFQSLQKIGTSENWYEHDGIVLTKVTRSLIQTAGSNGTTLNVQVESRAWRSYDSKNLRWSSWNQGRYFLFPSYIQVNVDNIGNLVAESSMLSQFMPFSAHGNPNVIPQAQDQEMPIQQPSSVAERLAENSPKPYPVPPANKEGQAARPEHTLNPIAALLSTLFIGVLGVVCLGGFLVVFKTLATPTFKGWFGEKMVHRALQQLDPVQYRVYHDLYLPHPTEAGTTQLDHVVVSPFGIFVIETKNFKGWIFGDENQRQWTQQIYRKKSRFQNPLHQNKLHVKALMQFLRLPEDQFLPVVFFIGNTQLKTAMPHNVLNNGLISWIRSHWTAKLIPPTFTQVVSQLNELERTTNRSIAAREHLAALKVRHGG